MKYWEDIKALKKAALEVGERVHIPYPEMVEEIEREWADEGISCKLVGVPGLPAKFYEVQRI